MSFCGFLQKICGSREIMHQKQYMQGVKFEKKKLFTKITVNL